MREINTNVNALQNAMPHIKFWLDENDNIRYEGKDGTHFYVDGSGYYPRLDEADAAMISAMCIGAAMTDLAQAMRTVEARGIVRIKKYIGLNACSAGKNDYNIAMREGNNSIEAAIDWAFADHDNVGTGHRAWILDAVLSMITPDEAMLAELTAQFPLSNDSYAWVEDGNSLYVGMDGKYWCESCQTHHERDERFDSDLFDYLPESLHAPLLKYLISKVS